MPIFQDAEQCFFIATQPSEPCALSTVKPKYSDESIWTEFCDGPLPDAPISNTVENEGVDSRKEEQSCNQGGVCTSDRNELMERIKRGESPTWIPSQTVRALQCSMDGVNICLCCRCQHCTAAPLMGAISDCPSLAKFMKSS